MSEIYCNSCFKKSISSDGVSCFHCGSYETRQIFLSDLHPPMVKPDNTGAEYFPNRQSFLLNPNTGTLKEGSMLLDHASIPTRANDFNSCVQRDDLHVHGNSITNGCLPEDNSFDQDSTINWKCVTVDPREIEYQPATKMLVSEIEDKTNYNQPILYPDTDASRIESVSSADDFLAVAGPSGLQNKMEISNLCEEEMHSRYSSKTHSISPRENKTLYTCRVCNGDISRHLHDGENYKCCFCPYQSSERSIFQTHSYDHQPANICSICEREYVGGSHNVEQACAVCPKTFCCRTLLREHYLDHNEYFETHCWYCCKKISDHRDKSDEKKSYACCMCEFLFKTHSGLKSHNGTHTPAKFCKICKEEFKAEEEQYHGKVFNCVLCEKTFNCQVQLEDHLADKKYSATHCPICKKKIEKHRRKQDEILIFECCNCPVIMQNKYVRDFTVHLMNHSNLRLFKCYSCGKRYSLRQSLDRHSKNCTSIPFKCEICAAGFDKKHSLNLHRSKIHN